VGNAYVAGYTASNHLQTLPTDGKFPVRLGPDVTFNGGFQDTFVAKVKADGSGLVYAGYIGGTGNDIGRGIAVDGAGNAYVTGETDSNQLPTEGKFPVKKGPDLTFNRDLSDDFPSDGFVAKVGGLPLFGIGVFRPGTIRWYLDVNRNGKWDGMIDDQQGPFGLPADLAVAGDWDGTGLTKIGIYRPGTRQFFLDRNGDGLFNNCTLDRCTGAFGLSGDLPVVGNWLGGANPTRIGVFRPNTQSWILDKNGNGVVDNCTVDLCLGPFGGMTDKPVAGDWNGDGKAEIGVFRPSTGQWFLDNGNGQWNGCGIELCVGSLGVNTDKPVVGDWTGDGKTKIGVYRPSNMMWYLDRNGDGKWNGCAVDLCIGPFGLSMDQPVAGAW
jgi:hypothetical protein